MRKPWFLVALGVLVLAIVVAIVLWRHGVGAAPQVSAALSARDTVGLVSLEGLDDIVRNADAMAAQLPANVKQMAGPLLDPAQRKAALGFDPATAAGWTGIGLDPQAGLALALDARVHPNEGAPTPMLLLRVTDRVALGKWLGARLGKPVNLGAADEGVRDVALGDRKVRAGRLHGWTTLLLDESPQPTDLQLNGFKQVLTGAGPVLGEDSAFRAAVAEAPAGTRAVAWGGLDGTAALLKAQKLPAEQLAIVDHLGHLFRGLAVYGGPAGGGARLVASADGVHALRQVLVPARDAPDFAAHVPGKGWAALRISLNLKEVFDGAMAFLPASLGQARGAVGAARMFMPMAVGFGWDDLTKALSGHAVIAVSLSSLNSAGSLSPAGDAAKGPVDWRAFLGVEDEKAADALLVQVIAAIRKRGLTVQDVTVAAAKGWKLEAAGLQAVLVRHGDLVILAPSVEAVQKCMELNKSDSLAAGTAADVLDGNAALAVVFDGAGAALLAGVAPSAEAAGPISLKLLVDDHGLLVSTTGNSADASRLVGSLAGLAAGQFQSYVDRSKAIEVKKPSTAEEVPSE